VSYAIHGRPPEGDCKPPQAADSAPYRAATHVSASSRVSNTWTTAPAALTARNITAAFAEQLDFDLVDFHCVPDGCDG
jgi:hypothetical protein